MNNLINSFYCVFSDKLKISLSCSHFNLLILNNKRVGLHRVIHIKNLTNVMNNLQFSLIGFSFHRPILNSNNVNILYYQILSNNPLHQ